MPSLPGRHLSAVSGRLRVRLQETQGGQSHTGDIGHEAAAGEKSKKGKAGAKKAAAQDSAASEEDDGESSE